MKFKAIAGMVMIAALAASVSAGAIANDRNINGEVDTSLQDHFVSAKTRVQVRQELIEAKEKGQYPAPEWVDFSRITPAVASRSRAEIREEIARAPRRADNPNDLYFGG